MKGVFRALSSSVDPLREDRREHRADTGQALYKDVWK